MATTDDTIKKSISQNITKYREKAGLSQKELANRLSVTPSRVSNWEQGANCPTIDILFEVCKILNVSINDIYGVYNDTNVKLTYHERQILEKYRELDSHGKELVDTVLDKESYRTHSQKRLQEYAKRIGLMNKAKESVINIDCATDGLLINETKAAHERTDIKVTDEMLKHDDDIMDSDDF